MLAVCMVCSSYACTHRKGARLIGPHSLHARHTPSEWRCMCHHCMWILAADGRWAQSEPRHLEHMHSNSFTAVVHKSDDKIIPAYT